MAEVEFGCEKVAEQVHKLIGGDFLQITSKNTRFLGPVKGEENLWTWHVAVIKDGKVYDRLTGSAGLDLDSYKALFDYNDGLNFEISQSITLR